MLIVGYLACVIVNDPILVLIDRGVFETCSGWELRVDSRVSNLLSPARFALPAEREVIGLGNQLLGEGQAADARVLLEDYLKFVPSTVELLMAASRATMQDPTLTSRERMARILYLYDVYPTVDPHSQLSEAKATAFMEVAEETKLLEDWERSYLEHQSLLEGKSSGEDLSVLLNCCYCAHTLIVMYNRRVRDEPWLAGRFQEITTDHERYGGWLRFVLNDTAGPHAVQQSDLLVLALAYADQWDRANQELLKAVFSESTVAQVLHRLILWSEAQSCSVGKREEPTVLRTLARSLCPEDPDRHIRHVRNSMMMGRVGLALSGGGFRAAFFHLGTLAALAERDLLRYVSVISTVSGGSIVGTLYYLELKKLLITKSDSSISRDDYIRAIKNIEANFREAVSKNIRMRAFGDYRHLLTGLFKARFNRSARAGELYDKLLYNRYMNEGHSLYDIGLNYQGKRITNFDRFNRWRAAKFPELVVNATSLSDGQSFSFAANWMGQRGQFKTSDAYFLSSIPLGAAVASSSCVPGLFDAVTLSRVLPDSALERIAQTLDRSDDARQIEHLMGFHSENARDNVLSLFGAQKLRELESVLPLIRYLQSELVDGGVYDNLGVEALLESGCNFVICSNGSSPLEHRVGDSGGFGVALRTSAVLMNRVVDLILQRFKSETLERGLCLIDIASLPAPTDGSSSGIVPALAEKIRRIRTDLDSFSDTEGATLMAAGYLASLSVIESKQSLPTSAANTDDPPAWLFKSVIPTLSSPEGKGSRRLALHLNAGRFRFLRPFLLSAWHLLWLPALVIAFFAIPGLLTAVRDSLRALVITTSASWLSVVQSEWWYTLRMTAFGIGIAFLYLLFYGIRFGLYDEQVDRVLRHVAQPRNIYRTALFSIVALATLPIRIVWIAIIDPFLRKSGRLPDTLQPGATAVERCLRVVTVISSLAATTFAGLAIYNLLFPPVVGFTVWRPDDCRLDLQNNIMRLESRIDRYVRTRSVSISDSKLIAFCQTRWNKPAMNVLAAETMPLRLELEQAENDPILKSRISQEREAHEFLREMGADEFVEFLPLSNILAVLYRAYLEEVGWDSGLPSTLAENVRLLSRKLNWDMDLSNSSSLGTAVLLSLGKDTVELLTQNSFSFPLSVLAAWLIELDSQPRKRFITIPPQHRAELASFVERVGNAAKSGKDRSFESDASSSEDLSPRSSARKLQLVITTAARKATCDLVMEITPAMAICIEEGRIFLHVEHQTIHANMNLGQTKSALIPPIAFDALAQVVAQQLE